MGRNSPQYSNSREASHLGIVETNQIDALGVDRTRANSDVGLQAMGCSQTRRKAIRRYG